MIHKFSRYLLTLVALLAMTTGAWAAGETYTVKFEANGKSVVKKNVTLPATYTFNLNGNGNFDQIIKELYSDKGGTVYDLNNTPKFSVSNAAVSRSLISGTYEVVFTISKAYEGKVTIYGVYGMSGGGSFNFTIDMSCYDPSTPVISDDKTSAEFEMPSYDATLEYDIVRNLASNMTVSIGDGQDGYRIRVKKHGESFVPAEMTLQQMMALYTVHDATEQKDLLFYGDGKVCDISIFAVDDQGQPTGQPVAFTALTPGRYVAIATAPDDSPLYAGQTPQSNIFVLYQGYEVTVPAGEYITYYRDEPLMVDKTQQPYAELYTISEVGTETATLSGPYDAMKTLTPMLVFNSSDDAQTILLIPTTEPDLAVTVAPEFKGTLEATEIAASDATTNNYAFNGKQFVWVKTALAVGQYKAWLEVPVSTSNNVKAIKLVLDDTTEVKEVTGVKEVNDDSFYDLNGRKLQSIPTRKGIYIWNGKKVVK